MTTELNLKLANMKNGKSQWEIRWVISQCLIKHTQVSELSFLWGLPCHFLHRPSFIVHELSQHCDARAVCISIHWSRCSVDVCQDGKWKWSPKSLCSRSMLVSVCISTTTTAKVPWEIALKVQRTQQSRGGNQQSQSCPFFKIHP